MSDGKMNPEIKAKWVAALRSGKYKQGTILLRHAGKHCCLGVLCEVTHPETLDAVDQQGGYYLVTDLLPVSWSIFSSMNDIAKKSFNEIADYIEANL